MYKDVHLVDAIKVTLMVKALETKLTASSTALIYYSNYKIGFHVF